MATNSRRPGVGLGPPQEGEVEQLRQNIERELDEIRSELSSASMGLDGAMPTGAVIPYAGAAAPSGWVLCDGSAISRTTYQRLFGVIGVSFGAGDGVTTFNVPNLVDRSPMGAGATVALAATAGALTTTHAHADGTLAVANHSHGVGTFGVDSHTHSADGTLAVAAHTHSDGTLAVAAHTHGPGTLTVASHLHNSGTLVTASHEHDLDDGGWAQITIDDPAGDVYMRHVAATSYNSTREASGAALAQLNGLISGAALDGATALSGTVDVSGNTGSTAPGVDGGATGSASPDVTGSTGSASPDVTGDTGGSTATISGTSGSTAPDVTGNTADASPSILHPVIGLNYIIRA